MGATNFFNVEFGKDAKEAFNKAVDEAIYRFGHESYSGTIKEKNGFVQVDIPTRLNLDKLETWCCDWDPEGKNSKIPKKYRDLVARCFRIYDDKWGPALCVKMTGKKAKEYKQRYGFTGKHGKVFIFMGFASE